MMRQPSTLLAVLAAALAAPALAAPAPAAPALAAPAMQSATCTTPIAPSDSAASLKKRFGKAARIEEVYLAEGNTGKAVVLFGNQPERRMEVLFWDDAMRQVSTVRWDGKGWMLAGLRIGDGVPQILTANGKPFTFYGFDWDYGGWVQDLGKGKLHRLPGGCSVSIRLEPAPGPSAQPSALTGDREIKSSDPLLKHFPPRISALSIDWPAPKGR